MNKKFLIIAISALMLSLTGCSSSEKSEVAVGEDRVATGEDRVTTGDTEITLDSDTSSTESILETSDDTEERQIWIKNKLKENYNNFVKSKATTSTEGEMFLLVDEHEIKVPFTGSKLNKAGYINSNNSNVEKMSVTNNSDMYTKGNDTLEVGYINWSNKDVGRADCDIAYMSGNQLAVFIDDDSRNIDYSLSLSDTLDILEDHGYVMRYSKTSDIIPGYENLDKINVANGNEINFVEYDEYNKTWILKVDRARLSDENRLDHVWVLIHGNDSEGITNIEYNYEYENYLYLGNIYDGLYK